MLARAHPSSLAAPPGGSQAALESRTRELGGQLLTLARQHQHASVLARFFSDRLFASILRDPRLKTQLFRFIDVFPALRTPEEIRLHLHEYLARPDIQLPLVLATALRAGKIFQGSFASAITAHVKAMAGNFIGGADISAALPTLAGNWERRLAFSVDLLGEACLSDAEALIYRNRYIQLIEVLPAALAAWPAQPVLESNHLGPLPRGNISLKITALDSRPRVADPEATVARLAAFVRPLLEAARDRGIYVNFDMEQYEYKDLTLGLFRQGARHFRRPEQGRRPSGWPNSGPSVDPGISTSREGR